MFEFILLVEYFLFIAIGITGYGNRNKLDGFMFIKVRMKDCKGKMHFLKSRPSLVASLEQKQGRDFL